MDTMGGRLSKVWVTLAAALLIVALLAACGEGDPDATGAEATGDGQPATAEAGRPNAKTGPLRVTNGGTSQFPDVADYSTLKYGEEASRPDLEQAARTMHGYLVAHVTYDWAASCSYLNESQVEEVDILSAHFKEVAGKPCPVGIAYLLGKVPAKETFETSEVEAGAFRIEGDHGYLFYRSMGGDPYMMPMSREDGDWKLYSLFTVPVSNPPN